MKFTVNWLKQYLDFNLTPAGLAAILTRLGLEVEAVERLYPGLEGIMVAQVRSVARHPNADKLSLCEVQVGPESRRVVCGAPNVRAGMLAPIALPGCRMPSGMEIKRSKIRGEVSEGMLCSAAELGLAADADGLMELPDTCVCGDTLIAALGLDDTLIEVDITPNRADCASLIGIAREVAGATGVSLKPPVSASGPLNPENSPFRVEVRAPEACPRYAACLLTNVTVGPSPWWLKRLLMAVGMRPINNVVDITNFVMLEYGQPLHAFDFSTLAGGGIVVREAEADEMITTLDGVERRLSAGTLLICDQARPIAVAGVMGGQNSEVSASTREVLLESAYFNPIGIRRASRELNLSSEAAYRFERGVDPGGTINALERAAGMIERWCGASRVKGGVDQQAKTPAPSVVILRVSRAVSRLGIELIPSEVAGLLAGIGIESETVDHDTLRARVPSFRVDLEREIDLIEEIARLKGYDQIPATVPLIPMSLAGRDPSRVLRDRLAAILIAQGCFEAINYSFISPLAAERLGLPESDQRLRQLAILNPLADDQAVMRTTLLPGLLENLRHNLNRQAREVSLFEIGKVFWPVAGEAQPKEPLRLGAVFSGRLGVGAPVFHYGERLVDLYDVKGIAETIFFQLGIEASFVAPEPPPYVEPGGCLQAVLGNGREIGQLGRFNRETLRRFGIKQPVLFLDFDLESLLKVEPAAKTFIPLSRFPSVTRDLAVVVPEEVGAGLVVDSILSGSFPLVSRVEIFDVYRGQPVEDGFKSVALSITYHSDEQTLDDRVVAREQGRIVEMLGSRFSARLREE